mmetsp:Transcript_5413/g.9549  ORF Transcript_5413/g.9549 Transcript_5413/m.9549 type:complete len:84 (+) Transcript_5413:2758-3009(+)
MRGFREILELEVSSCTRSGERMLKSPTLALSIKSPRETEQSTQLRTCKQFFQELFRDIFKSWRLIQSKRHGKSFTRLRGQSSA